MSQPANPAAPQQVQPLLVLATKFLRDGRPADAIVPLRDAALLQPSNPAILHDLGLACLEVGRIPEAIAALQRAVTSDPRYADAYFRLGIALEKLGNIGGAISAYDEATKLLPSLTEAWFAASRWPRMYTRAPPAHCEPVAAGWNRSKGQAVENHRRYLPCVQRGLHHAAHGFDY
jgi:Flp pilus assembly protein TadD